MSSVEIEMFDRIPDGNGSLNLRGLANYQGKLIAETPGSIPINRGPTKYMTGHIEGADIGENGVPLVFYVDDFARPGSQP